MLSIKIMLSGLRLLVSERRAVPGPGILFHRGRPQHRRERLSTGVARFASNVARRARTLWRPDRRRHRTRGGSQEGAPIGLRGARPRRRAVLPLQLITSLRPEPRATTRTRSRTTRATRTWRRWTTRPSNQPARNCSRRGRSSCAWKRTPRRGKARPGRTLR